MSSARLEQIEDAITAMLVDLGLPPEPLAEGTYAFRYGGTAVLVSLFWASELAWVRIATTLLKDFRPNLELVTRVLRLNTEVLFGAFLIFEDDTLTFAITLPGVGLQAEVFGLALDHVARISNAYGEELKAIAGGRLASDIVAE
ncbi:MAG: YbjN domain-containing protein [Pseudomonadota bacterium]